MILRTYVVFSPRTPLLFLLTSKWLIYKVESYDEVQNLKSCTFSLRSSSPLNEEARKAWLGTTRDRLSSPGLMRLRHYTSSLNLESRRSQIVEVKGHH